MPPAMFGRSAKPLSGRYLLFAEREEIALLRSLALAAAVYPSARVEAVCDGLLLKPSSPPGTPRLVAVRG